MADPFSAAANVITVLGVAARSCHYLLEIITKFADAPDDVRQHLVWLHALHSTFCELEKLAGDAVLQDVFLDIPESFTSRLQHSVADLLSMEQRLHKVADRLKKRGLAHAWARTKFAFDGDRWIKKFFERLQMYQATFTLDLMHLQIKTTAKVSSSLQEIRVHQRSIQCIAPSTAVAYIAKPPLKRSSDCVVLRTDSWSHYQTCIGSIACWSGGLVARPSEDDWDNSHSPKNLYSPNRGSNYGMVFRGFGSKAAIMLLFKKYRTAHGSLSFHCNLSFSAIIRNDADLFKFVRNGDIDGVRSVFAMGKGAPSDTAADGTGLLHTAIRHCTVEMIAFLIREGADVNARDEDGVTPLHVALSTGKEYELSRVLLENGADISSRDIDGGTPLHTLFNPTTASILTHYGSAIDDMLDRNKYGMTILQYVSWSSKSGPEHFISLLQHDKIHAFTSRDAEGRSVLHFAAQRGNLGILNYALSLPGHIDVEARDRESRTPLHYAVQSKRIEAIDVLVASGATLRAIDTKGRSVLHYAAMHNNMAAIERLIQLGATHDLGLLDRDGNTPLQAALRRRALKAARCLTDLSYKRSCGQTVGMFLPLQHHDGVSNTIDDFIRERYLGCAQISVERAFTVSCRPSNPVPLLFSLRIKR